MIVEDYQNIGPDTSWITWLGAFICFAGIILFFPLASMIKRAKNK